MRKIIIVIAFAALIAGCATKAQLRAQNMKAQWEQAGRDFKECGLRTETVDLKNQLSATFIFGSNDPKAIEKMAIDRHATESEKSLSLQYRTSTVSCRQKALESLNKIHPRLVSLIAGFFAENDELILKLVKNEITVGQINQWANSIEVERHKKLIEAVQQIDQELMVAHQDEMRGRQAAAAALQQWSYQQQLLNQNQQLINAMNRPAVTNCNYIGQMLSCTTY